MQATCEKCGKTITQEDFSAGRYYLFWITPTIPPESLWLCQDCQGIPWEEKKRLFEVWWERRESDKGKSRPASTKRAPRARASRKRTQTKPDEPSPKSPSPTPAARATKKRVTTQPVAAKRTNGKPQAEIQAQADHRDATPWWEDPVRKHEKFQELAQMIFDLS